eukprot:3468181-Alexandrium_andersonii.AAC.1
MPLSGQDPATLRLRRLGSGPRQPPQTRKKRRGLHLGQTGCSEATLAAEPGVLSLCTQVRSFRADRADRIARLVQCPCESGARHSVRGGSCLLYTSPSPRD